MGCRWVAASPLMAIFKPYSRRQVDGRLWLSIPCIIVGIQGIIAHAIHDHPLRLMLFSVFVAYIAVSTARALWHRYQYAIADEENRKHGK